jgi:RNA-directed DNA polymerase
MICKIELQVAGEIMSQSEETRYKWDTINWKKIQRSVFKLQKRIYQASKANDLKKVHSLQRLLLNSKSAKLLAVRKVSQLNKGKKTAGVDGVKSLSPMQRLKLASELKLNEKSQPVRRIWIPKPGKTEKRPLGIPTMADRAKQALVKQALEPQWEARFEPNSYGFRPARSSQDAVSAVFKAISLKNAYVLDADISGCFDNIDHQALLKKLDTFPKVYRSVKDWLNSGIMEGTIFLKSKAGTPQGGVISPLLANIALHGLEYGTKEALKMDLFNYKKRIRGKASYKLSQNSITIIRFADDFVILHESREIIEKAKKHIVNWLKQIGLNLNEKKTKIVHTLKSTDGCEVGFNFLGFWIRQYYNRSIKRGYVTLIKPSLESQKKHRKLISEKINKLKAATQERVISTLNSLIRGWANYYRHQVARKAFETADNYMFIKLWKWARWRHPNLGLKRIKRKYFRQFQNSNWRFSTHDGKVLISHGDIHIIRHMKIHGTRTPYDGDSNYWNKRKRLGSNLRCV